jgi:hypothetical protein
MSPSIWQDRQNSEGTTPEVVAAISGSHWVVERFGRWLKFEDAEVISLTFNRGNLTEIFRTGRWSEAIPPSLEAVFYVFDASVASDSSDRKPTLLTMRFSELDRFALNGFNHQNPIVELAIIREHSERLRKDLFAVDWGGAGIFHEASFTCGKIEVVKLESLPTEIGTSVIR